ncbi:MAG TPA: rhomboid family intramembrane serine protease [Anaerolineaceae bacterium]|nr:rhomboid family intramembrane serine protease [Anaerolineaceae bacterium]HOR83338.1 rhomboid family intramembrane serine protease [Anaerolineaceae bacterium]HPL42958.1 rhomboid family intramembrane serine protease [Anaerolineaceae bacterium]
MNGQIPEERPTAPESPAQTRRVALEIEKPVVTYVLMGVIALFFIAQTLCTQFLGFDLPAALLSKIRSQILAGQLWRLITPILLHGSILHVGLNLYALWILGRQLEGIYGHWRFLILFLVAGFGGNVLSFVFSPNVSLGSSTGIFGLLAAEFLLILQNKQFFGPRARAMLGNLVFIFLLNIAIGIAPGSNIDNFGHLGGVIAGGLFAFLAGPKWELQFGASEPRVQDARHKNDTIAALLIVFIGFSLIAAIPFLKF